MICFHAHKDMKSTSIAVNHKSAKMKTDWLHRNTTDFTPVRVKPIKQMSLITAASQASVLQFRRFFFFAKTQSLQSACVTDVGVLLLYCIMY